jgi:hypothetical protein
MIDKIKDWLFFKYGVQIETKHLWMILILVGSLVLLLVSWLFNGGVNKKFDPSGIAPLPGMPMGMPAGQIPVKK